MPASDEKRRQLQLGQEPVPRNPFASRSHLEHFLFGGRPHALEIDRFDLGLLAFLDEKGQPLPIFIQGLNDGNDLGADSSRPPDRRGEFFRRFPSPAAGPETTGS